jgi:hypothetical protein
MSTNDQRHEKFGYNWIKNKVLLRMVPGVEVWEDLHPAGSILKIFNAQVGINNFYTVHMCWHCTVLKQIGVAVLV